MAEATGGLSGMWKLAAFAAIGVVGVSIAAPGVLEMVTGGGATAPTGTTPTFNF